MYERFTDRARKVMELATQEAQRFNHEYIGPEHVLLGLVKEGSGVAASVLKDLGIDLSKVRHAVEKITPHGAGGELVAWGRLPQTPHTKMVLNWASEEARHLNHLYVGTEHLLLGLLRAQEGVAAQVLMSLGAGLPDVRAEVLSLLGCNGALVAGVTPAHVVVDALNTILDAPTALTGEQLQLVRDRVRHLNEQKAVFIAALDFTLAARCSAEAEALTRLLAWYDQAHEAR